MSTAQERYEQALNDNDGEFPDSYLDRVDGHWYVTRYDSTLPQIHALDCATCLEVGCMECGAPLDDGEGYDGLCGTCADRAADELFHTGKHEIDAQAEEDAAVQAANQSGSRYAEDASDLWDGRS